MLSQDHSTTREKLFCKAAAQTKVVPPLFTTSTLVHVWYGWSSLEKEEGDHTISIPCIKDLV